MKKNVLLIVGLGMTLTTMSQSINQELLRSSGDHYANSSYQLDWSIGECIIATKSKGNYMITQGFHQGNYSNNSLINNLSYDEIYTRVCPNPTADFITINIANSVFEDGKLTCFLNDINGKLLLREEINQQEKQLNFSNYTKGIYFLSLKRDNQVIKSFKIVKN